MDALPENPCCILFKNYIKPQRKVDECLISRGCILFKNYIKPQLYGRQSPRVAVVSYLKTTSNHNFNLDAVIIPEVVSYLKTTSNHNSFERTFDELEVVSYLKTTSNHNHGRLLY